MSQPAFPAETQAASIGDLLFCFEAFPPIVMLSRQPVPRIRIDFPDSSLSPSGTIDIKDVLGTAKLLPKLLAEEFEFDPADHDSYLESGRLQDLPSFPVGRRPPLFILNCHRAQLPFHIRPDVFELGDFCRDEDHASSLLTAPTVPRMKMLMKEPLYVQKWVDKLLPDSPPKHIPWTCEKPITKRQWIAEGSIFPADRVKSCAEQCKAVQEHTTIPNRSSAIVDQASHSREPCALLEASIPTHASKGSYIRVKPADVDPGILRGESMASHSPRRIVRTLLSPQTLLPVGSPLGAISDTRNAPLATRRGKTLIGLKLKQCVIEHLEYPDIPTAFRGSPIILSPRFDSLPGPTFMDHESMLLVLRSKCAALGDGVPADMQEPLSPQTELTRTSLSVDEWAFARGLATYDGNSLESIDGQMPTEIIADTIPDGSSTTPVEHPSTPNIGLVPRHQSTTALPSAENRSSDPPGLPLPPRPALINPSTPPHVRGILKKTKNVRFEDMTINESESCAFVATPQVSLEPPSPVPAAVSSERRTSIPPAPVKEALGKNIQKKSPSGSRLPPKRTRPLEPTLNCGNASETAKPTVATAAERLCRTAHAKENADPAAIPQAKQKASSVPEVDVRRGIEGSTKNRLSTPLRNIFRFR